MKKILLLVLLLSSLSAVAFDVKERQFSMPNPASICQSNETMFGGASVIYSDCADDIDNIVTTKIISNRSFSDFQQFISQYQPDGSFTDYDITDALYDGSLVTISPLDSKIRVASNGSAIRFCLSDRTVYLIKNNAAWLSITLISK